MDKINKTNDLFSLLWIGVFFILLDPERPLESSRGNGWKDCDTAAVNDEIWGVVDARRALKKSSAHSHL